jgi:hypothetical protein
MEDVRKADSLDWSNPLLVRVLTFDGFEVRVEAVEEADAHWLRLLASAPFASVVTTGPESVPDGEDADESLDPGRVAEDLQARVEAFNAKVSAWAYKLPSYKFDSMNKRLEDLLKPLDGNDAEAGR